MSRNAAVDAGPFSGTTIGILGLGLIGGSLAHDLSAAGARVLGWDTDAPTRAAALDAGAAQGLLDANVAYVDALIIAVPVDRAPALLRHVDAGLVMDTGSTKRSIGAAAAQAGIADRFVGAHPLAGDHRAGFAAARPGLFADARVFLCPTPATQPAPLTHARRIWEQVGARVELMDPAVHDQQHAWTSHLPQLLATAAATILAEAGITPEQLGPGGRDTLRLAGSNPMLWTAIAMDNSAYLGDALARLRLRIAELELAVRHRDADALERSLSAAAAWHEGTTRGARAVF